MVAFVTDTYLLEKLLKPPSWQIAGDLGQNGTNNLELKGFLFHASPLIYAGLIPRLLISHNYL